MVSEILGRPGQRLSGPSPRRCRERIDYRRASPRIYPLMAMFNAVALMAMNPHSRGTGDELLFWQAPEGLTRRPSAAVGRAQCVGGVLGNARLAIDRSAAAH